MQWNNSMNNFSEYIEIVKMQKFLKFSVEETQYSYDLKWLFNP